METAAVPASNVVESLDNDNWIGTGLPRQICAHQGWRKDHVEPKTGRPISGISGRPEAKPRYWISRHKKPSSAAPRGAGRRSGKRAWVAINTRSWAILKLRRSALRDRSGSWTMNCEASFFLRPDNAEYTRRTSQGRRASAKLWRPGSKIRLSRETLESGWSSDTDRIPTKAWKEGLSRGHPHSKDCSCGPSLGGQNGEFAHEPKRAPELG